MFIYIVAGLTTGAVYGLAGAGLVLSYKTSGIFNFAHGAQASASAFLFYYLWQLQQIPWPVAAVLCVLVAGPVFGLFLEWASRRVALRDLPTKVVATIGLLLAIEGLLDLLSTPGIDRQVPQFLPTGSIQILHTSVQSYRIIIFGIGLASVLALTIALRYTRTGVAMRGVVDDPELLDISGTSPVRTRRRAWMIGSIAAAAAGVLIAPLVPLDATTLTFLIVTAFGAAAIGGFTSLPITFVGGLAIGVGQALLQEYIVNSTGLLGGLSGSLPFLILFALLIFSPRLRRPSAAKITVRNLTERWQFPSQIRFAGMLAAAVVLLAVPIFAGAHLADWTRFLAYIVVFLSLGLLVRSSGQVSLAHVGFMAIGVCAFSDLAYVHHWPWLLAVLVAAAIAAPIGALLAIPAIRFPGLYLALATLGFGILLEQMFYTQAYMFGPYGLGTNVPMPHVAWLGLVGPKGYYYVAALTVALVAGVLIAIDRSRLGRILKAMGDSPAGLTSVGTSINVSRVLVFAIAAALAAVAGILDAGAIGVVGAQNYDPLLSLELFAVVMVAVGGAPWYAVIGAAGLILVPAYIGLSAQVGYVLTLIFGLSAMAFAAAPIADIGVPAPFRRVIDRHFRSPDSATKKTDSIALSPPPAPASLSASPTDLRISSVSVRYGGHVAAHDITLHARPGHITGLIGPNGAGKTTVFNAICGLVKPVRLSTDSSTSPDEQEHPTPTRSHVLLGGEVLDRRTPSGRARRGLGRTFQQMELFESLTVMENIGLGYEGSRAGLNPLRHLFSRRADSAEVAVRTSWALELCNITEMADRPVANLSTGQRRLVEMARCIAGDFAVLLLDEPSSGLDNTETRAFGEVLRRVVSQRQLAVLLIEHDMALVNQLCDYVYVIDFGEHLFEGTPAEVGSSDIVRSAYLGEVDLSASTEVRAAPELLVFNTQNGAVPACSTRSDEGATPVLEINHLDSGYGRTPVLRDVSIRVQAGEVVALLGANGAGKTTLLRTISGVLRHTSGEIRLEGQDIGRLEPFRRASMGLCSIPEGRGVFRTLTVAENLRLQLPPGPRSDEAVEHCLEVFPALRERMSARAGNLSGGQQQMLALGRAYLTDPRIVLLDEVSMGLAPIAVDAMFEAIERLSAAGTALLLVEQYVSRAIAMADSVVLLRKGHVVFTGPASELDDDAVLESYLGMDVPLAAGAEDVPAQYVQ
jgi:ABC-type branched-subunit amino acid transport system ATPase component/branched-subunit amino acid ABC-type transport system permease component